MEDPVDTRLDIRQQGGKQDGRSPSGWLEKTVRTAI